MEPSLFAHAVELIDHCGLERVAASLKQTLKYTIHLETSPAHGRSLGVGTSRLGGWPDLPAVLSWPTWNQVPMAFLAQINLAEVAPYDREYQLPPQGWLYFFCRAEGALRGQEFAGLPDLDYTPPGSWRVLFFDGSAANLHPYPFPDGLPQAAFLAPCTLK